MLSNNAKEIFTKLYSLPGEEIDDVFMRTSQEFSKDKDDGCCKIAFDLQKDNIWRPNSPVFFNSGGKIKLFSACWVTALEDSMDGIYSVVDSARKIFQYGAGIGIPVGNLREKDAFIFEQKPDKEPIGKSSGPISFMTLFDAVGETTKSGGRSRRAAIMCAMPISHPDIMDFIKCKEVDGHLSNMNISVVIDDKFMKALDDNVTYTLISPNGNKTIGELNAKDMWETLAEMAWKSGDPGVLFIDTVNRMNPLKKIKLIETSNPCGEQVILPGQSCNLSAINLTKFIDDDGNYNYDKLSDTAYNVMTLMDNLIDKMDFPTDEFKKNVTKYRPTGIGPMGLSDALYMLNVKYDSVEGRELAGKMMKTITSACILCSSHLAKERGKFADYDLVREDTEEIISKLVNGDDVIMESVRENGLRNITHTTAAPTGSTALSCDCSYGIEPCFGLVFQKNLIDGGTMHMVNPVFREKYEEEEWFSESLLTKIAANGGSLKGIRGVPKEVRDVFVVAHDIKYKDRIDMQSILQKHISSAISSTINLPSTATVEEISSIYKYAYEKELKGITIYRDGCKKSQPVTFTKTPEGNTKVVFNRPTKLTANVHTVETGNGKLYITVSAYNGKPVEVFMNMGKSGQTFNVFSEALGRTISIALQQGVSVDDLIATLDGINSDRVAWYRFEETDKKPTQILSIPDALAKLLKRYYTGKTEVEPTGTGTLCDKCGTYSVMKIEGCAVCQNCGESKCG